MPLPERNRIENQHFALIRLETEQDFKSDFVFGFDSGDDDLNDFFRNDAFDHHNQLLAATYCMYPREALAEEIFAPLALVSFLNDSIKIQKDERGIEKIIFWKWLKNNIPHPKRLYKSFPAVKIGRLALPKEYQRKHIGTSLLNLTKKFFLTNNRTGCRFLTVDAYNCAPVINFYRKNGFDFLDEKDQGKDTRIMWFDLLSYTDY